jgi:hypothetical protein
MYIVKNIIDDVIIGKFKTDADFTHFMRNIAIENDDADISITCIGEAKDYLTNYCSNLALISPSFTVSLTFEGITSNNPLEAVKTAVKWINEGVNEMTFDVTDEITNEKFTVDLSEVFRLIQF